MELLQPKSNLEHFSFKIRNNCNSFSYFPENQLTKLANLVQFKGVLMSSGSLGRRGVLDPLVCCYGQSF